MAYCYYWLAKAYDEILNDDINFIKYAKKAYELDSTRLRYRRNYYMALLEGKKFNEAKKLSHTKSYRALYKDSELEQLKDLYYYYYFQENYKKAEELLNHSLANKWGWYLTFVKMLTYAQLGDRKKVDKLLNNYYSLIGSKWHINIHTATTYAILKEKDSMYHYLEKLRPIDKFHEANRRKEFDPYRKEERFKALLKKHYLPITHWNE